MESKLIIELKEKLYELLINAPSEDELDDYKLSDFFASAKSLYEDIEDLGF